MILVQYRCTNVIILVFCYFLVLSTCTVPKAYNKNASYKRTYREGDPLKLTVNKLTSTKTLLPVDYNKLPFCRSRNESDLDVQNLGQFLSGDRVRRSPYEINFKEDKYCEKLCVINLGREEIQGLTVIQNKITRAINNQYHHNWKLDDKPIINGFFSDQSTLQVPRGFPVGYSTKSLRKSYIYNHVKIQIHYHRVQNQKDSFTIGDASITPYSIRHEYGKCPNMDKRNVSLDDVTKYVQPQPASGESLFTYDVVWIENTHFPWDDYITRTIYPSQVFWFSCVNSFMLVFFLSLFLLALYTRNCRQSLQGYQKLESLDDKIEFLERFSWKLVHADIFRPPPYPMVMSVVCGTGIQIFLAVPSSLALLHFGFLKLVDGGAYLMTFLLMYVLMGFVSGYISANLYKTFRCRDWMKNALVTALALPSISFATFGLVQCFGAINGSSLVVPSTTIASLLIICFLVETPLVLMGSYLGQKHQVIYFPVNTGNFPSQIPDQPWHIRVKLHILLGGFFSFSSMYISFVMLMMQLWKEVNAVKIGAILIAFIPFVMTVSISAPIVSMMMFNFQNYHWWWHSFHHGASISIFIILYSIRFSLKFSSPLLATYVLFYSYMGLLSLMVGVMSGSIAFLSALCFNLKLFGSMKCFDEYTNVGQVYHDNKSYDTTALNASPLLAS